MPRTLKGTRIKWLPPRVQLRNKDALTGSIPSHTRIASDNRTGGFTTFFDDQKTVLFQSHNGTPWHTITGSGPGFNPCAASGSYPNYNLGPSIASGGNVYLWWPCEEVITSGALITGSNSYLIDSGSGDHKGRICNPLSGAAIQDVPPYYNNITTTFPNSSSYYQFNLVNGNNSVVVDPILSGALVTSGSTAFTLSVHVNFDSLQDYNPILWRGFRDIQTSDWQLLVTVSGALELGVFDSSTGAHRIYRGSTGRITTSTWYHVLAYFSEAGSIKFYINGVSESPSVITDTGWTGFNNFNNQLYLGALFDVDYISGSRVSLGAFDNVVIANRVATADEISYLYLGGPIPGIPYFAVPGVGLALPSGLHTSNPALYRFDQTGSLVRNEELFSDIAVSGAIRKGVGDAFVSFTPGQDFQPFQDEANPAVDGLSTNSPFYATGSNVIDIGEGFDQPLWSKSKFEVDLTPAVSHSFFIQNYTSSSNNFTMAYWNTSRHVWEGIGAGKEFGLYTIGSQSYFQALCEDQCIGFGSGINQGSSGVEDFSLGAKVSNYGFPYHVKYHGTSSNLISMSDYISSPFLLEKIVIEWSGSLEFNNTAFGTSTNYTVCTFFILNQRKPFGYNDPNVQQFVYRTVDGHTSTLITGALIPSSYNNGSQYNTIRELVTYAQVVGFSNISDATQIQRGSRELNLLSSDPAIIDANGAWSGRLVMSGTVKNALPNDGMEPVFTGHNDSGMSAMMLINKNSTRSGLFTPGGRDFIGALEKGHVLSSSMTLQSNFPASTDPTGSIIVLDRYSKPNPYLLQPTDQLILGWQLPVATRLNSSFGSPQYNGKGTEMTFAPVPSKITFYGSMISEGREHHDTLNQLLTSVSIHEVIGG